jgi:hypothetical protein
MVDVPALVFTFNQFEDNLDARRSLRLGVERVGGDNMAGVFTRRQRREVFGRFGFTPSARQVFPFALV